MTRRAGRGAARLAQPLVAGLLVAGSLPPSSLWPLAPVGIAVLSRCLAGRGWRARATTGALAGFGQFGVGCWWALQFTAAGYIALVLVESAFLALACIATPPGRGRLLALPGLVVLAEWGRDAWPFGGLPLAGIALGQANGPLLGVARLGGPLLVVGAACALGTAIDQLANGPNRKNAWQGLAGLALVAALVAVSGIAPDGGPAADRLRVAAVQGGGRRGLDALEVPAASVLAAQLAATRHVGGGTDLVVWPEDSVSLARPLTGSPVERLLAGVASGLRATLVAGVTEPAGPGRFRNEVAAWSPAGGLVAIFEKVHPVPFGEYVPFRSVLSRLVSFAAVPRDAVAGHASGMVRTPAGRLAMLISYETFFAGRGRAGVRGGGELLVVSTNTASYRTDQIPSQELAASRLQAVEEGRDLVQAASTGFSALVDHRGDVLASSALGTPAVERSTLALRVGRTLYERAGDVPALVAALAAAAGGWLVARLAVAAPAGTRRARSRPRRARGSRRRKGPG